MTVVVISPEHDHPREHAVLAELFAAGLERFHVRKPHASAAGLEAYVRLIPAEYRSRVVMHQHHEVAEQLALGGRHWRDEGRLEMRMTAAGGEPASSEVGRDRWARRQDIRPEPARPAVAPYLEQQGGSGVGPDLRAGRSDAIGAPADFARPAATPYLGQPSGTTLTSRSCHDLATLRASLGHYDSVFFGPVFPSISKPGYGPTTSEIGEALGAILRLRTPDERRTAVIAIGGIDTTTARRALALGFDGVAVLGAVWQAEDPVAAFRDLQAVVVEPDVPIGLSAHSQTSAMRTSRST